MYRSKCNISLYKRLDQKKERKKIKKGRGENRGFFQPKYSRPQ